MHRALAQLKQDHLIYGGGIVSLCSAQPPVLKTAMQMALESSRPLLIEVTANQVNQFGGYTGMTPVQFATYIRQLASRIGLDEDQLILGADHLGPWVWKDEPAGSAMAKAEALLYQCLRAGFQKIHLDTTQGCADDPQPIVPVELNAQRSARLCSIAESISNRHAPAYVIGSDVPLPGGGLEGQRAPVITDPERLMVELETFENAFGQSGSAHAWQRVIAMVVQPGVDFGDAYVAPYQSAPAAGLSAAHGRLPDHMTYEIHAADYQRPQALKQMNKDHFVLLKIGPCITFAMRRALYALADIEVCLPGIDTPSDLPRVMEKLMIAKPDCWQSHYQGRPEQIYHLRHNSMRDRIRYYWLRPRARAAVERLMENLQRPLPASLLDQYLPELAEEIQDQGLNGDPAGIVRLAIRQALTPYFRACRQS